MPTRGHLVHTPPAVSTSPESLLAPPRSTLARRRRQAKAGPDARCPVGGRPPGAPDNYVRRPLGPPLHHLLRPYHLPTALTYTPSPVTQERGKPRFQPSTGRRERLTARRDSGKWPTCARPETARRAASDVLRSETNPRWKH